MSLLASKHHKDQKKTNCDFSKKCDKEDKDEDNVQEAVVNETKKKIRTAKSEGEFDMLKSILDIDQFERINNVQLMFFGLCQMYSYLLNFERLSKKILMDSFFFSEGSVHRYMLSNGLAKMVNFNRKQVQGDWHKTFRRYVRSCSSLEVIHRHQAICYQRDGVQIKINDQHVDHHTFKNSNVRWFVPSVI